MVGNFSDGNSALMLVCARLRHVADSQWGNKKYMNMKHMRLSQRTSSFLTDFIQAMGCKLNLQKTFDITSLLSGFTN